MYNVETGDVPLNCSLFWLISEIMQIIPYIYLPSPIIGWQVTHGKLYAHTVTLGRMLLFPYMMDAGIEHGIEIGFQLSFT